MSIAVRCINCGKGLRVEDSWAGKRVRCKACGNVMVVAIPEVVEVPPDELRLIEEPLEEYEETEIFTPPPISTRRLDYSSQPATPYFSMAGEDAIDAWLPWAAVVLLLVTVAVTLGRAVSTISTMSSARGWSAQQIGYAFGFVFGGVIGLVVIKLAIVPALLLLGIWIASQILRFPNPRLLYWRCLAVECLSIALDLILKGFDTGGPPIFATWFLRVLACLAMLWLLLRLRPRLFALAGGLAVLLGLAIPFGLVSLGTTFAANTRGSSPGSLPNVLTMMDSHAGARANSAARLHKIGLGLLLYAQDFHQRGPDTLDQLSAENLAPGDLVPPVQGITYQYRGYDSAFPEHTVVACEQGDRSLLGGVHILFASGEVKFFPGNTADPVLQVPTPPMRSTPQMFTPSAFQAVPMPATPPPVFHPIPTPTPIPTNTPPPAAAPQVDPTPMLQKIADADQAFARANGTFATSIKQLGDRGFLQAQDAKPALGQALLGSGAMPTMNPIPAQIIVVYVLDIHSQTYTVLFGDWHIESFSSTRFREVRKQSTMAKFNATRAPQP